MPTPLRMLLFFLLLGLLAGFVQLGVLRIAFDKLGLSPESAWLLFVCTLGGSLINLPLLRLRADGATTVPPPQLQRWPLLGPAVPGSVAVGVNVGGALVPAAFSLYLIAHNPLSLLQVAGTVAAVTAVAYATSRPIPRVGIGMPMLLAPLVAALVATLLNPAQRAPLAYVGGTLGVLIGADLLRLRDLRKLGAPWAAIGGAGSFDGVFLSGLVAVLLA